MGRFVTGYCARSVKGVVKSFMDPEVHCRGFDGFATCPRWSVGVGADFRKAGRIRVSLVLLVTAISRRNERISVSYRKKKETIRVNQSDGALPTPARALEPKNVPAR